MATQHPSNRPTFEHTPLNRVTSSIRLVQVLPELSPEGLIQCQISHTTVSVAHRHLSYRCLSYRWGEEYPEMPILINGSKFNVRHQLYDFLVLQRSRLPISRPRRDLFWIDALCIDQKNPSERNQQVAQMGRIFHSASRVDVWLGKTPLLSSLYASYHGRFDLADRYLVYTGDQSRLCSSSGDLSPLLIYTAQAYQDLPLALRQRLDLAPRDPDSIENRNLVKEIIDEEVLYNEYWTRAWITQEVCLARSAVLVLEHETHDVYLSKLLDVVRGSSSFVNRSHLSELLQFLDTSEEPRSGSGSYNGQDPVRETLVPLVHRFRDKACTIPRDRIFSILPLYRWSHLIEVNYQLPDDELVVNVLHRLREAVNVCSVAVMAHSLRPRSGPFTSGYMEMDMLATTFHWGPLEAIRMQEPQSFSEKGPASYIPIYVRSLDSIGSYTVRKGSSYSGTGDKICKMWILMRNFILKQITLVGLPHDRSWQDLPIPGQEIQLPIASVQHHAIDHPKALPKPGNSKQWRMYTEGATFQQIEGALDVLTLRISLDLVWEFVETWEGANTWDQIEPCTYACGYVRLGCRSG